MSFLCLPVSSVMWFIWRESPNTSDHPCFKSALSAFDVQTFIILSGSSCHVFALSRSQNCYCDNHVNNLRIIKAVDKLRFALTNLSRMNKENTKIAQ